MIKSMNLVRVGRHGRYHSTESDTEMKSMDNNNNNKDFGRNTSTTSSLLSSIVDNKISLDDKEEATSNLWKSISSHSKQECALEILTRLKYFLSKYPCCYELLGVEIDRSSIRDFIVAIIVTNILSFMWDSFD